MLSEGMQIVIGSILDMVPHFLGFDFVNQVGTDVRPNGLRFEFDLSMLCMIELYSLIWYLFQIFVGIPVLSG